MSGDGAARAARATRAPKVAARVACTRASEAMARFTAGEDRAFDALYAALAPRLYRTAVLLVGQDEADDLLQEVFLKIYRAREAFAPGGNVVAWSLAITRTTSIDRLRRRRRKERATDATVIAQRAACDTLSPECLARSHALSERVLAALRTLSEPLRSAYVLVRFEELSCAEAAVVLGTTTNAIKQRVHRAQDSVKTFLEPAE